MATAQDVIDELIKQTESGELEWEAKTDSGGYWISVCDEVHFQVRKSGLIEVFGRVPTASLGNSSTLVTMLQHHKPLDAALESAREEALQLALRCLTEKSR